MCQLFENDVWCEENFGAVDFKDKRLNSRLRKMVTKIASHPDASLPDQMGTWGDVKGAYRFLNNESVTHKRIQTPHREKVKKEAKKEGKNGTVLFLQDGSELESQKAAKGMGPIGNHDRSGLLMHNSLAVKYDELNPKIIGLAHQTVWKRACTSLCRTETRQQRNNRQNRESTVWLATLKAIGSPPSGSKWVSVGDRGNDIYEFLVGAKQLHWEVLVRASQDRVIEVEGEQMHLMTKCRQLLPVMGTRTIAIRKKGETKSKEITVNIAWEQVRIKPPKRISKKCEDMELSVVRCWNDEEGIDWILYSTIPVNNLEEAIEKIEWYTCRWIIEEYHKCLKTGCRIESSQLESKGALEAHLGILAIVAILMLQLRNTARESGNELAKDIVPEIPLKIICKRYNIAAEKLTIYKFWHLVANLGGFLGRKSDGEPGWQTLWRGWLKLLDMWIGAETFTSILQ